MSVLVFGGGEGCLNTVQLLLEYWSDGMEVGGL